MRYKEFRIKNFKGISDATVKFDRVLGASVFPFVGLNESGKTTILQAIHSFSPDKATSDLVSEGKDVGVTYQDRVPRHLVSTFDGRVSVTAIIEFSDDQDRTEISDALGKIDIIVEKLPREFKIERYQEFSYGDYVRDEFSLLTKLRVKTARQRKFREPNHDELTKIRDTIYGMSPEIAFFPTFVFEYPSKIYLTSRGDPVTSYYRNAFQDVLSAEGSRINIKRDIARRIRSRAHKGTWESLTKSWQYHDDKKKIDHIMDKAGVFLTDYVFGHWNKIFGEQTKGKELIVEATIDEGEFNEEDGWDADQHDIYIKFRVKDGKRRFDIEECSLGFRWFFAFILLAEFRSRRSQKKLFFFFLMNPRRFYIQQRSND